MPLEELSPEEKGESSKHTREQCRGTYHAVHTTFFPLVTKQFATIWAVGCSRRVFANVLARQTRTCMSTKALCNNKRRGQHESPHTHSKDQQLATIGASLTVHFRLFWLHKAITGRTHTSAWAFYQSTTGKTDTLLASIGALVHSSHSELQRHLFQTDKNVLVQTTVGNHLS